MNITVIVTRYNEKDALILTCLKSLAAQKDQDVLVLFLDQKKSSILEGACLELSNANVKITYKTIQAKSLSFARNTGISTAFTDLVAFCDADCILPANWTKKLREVFQSTNAAIVGTKIIPKWPSRPKWYQKSKYILEFYSMIDISSSTTETNKIVGASFAIDKKILGNSAYFDEKLGRQAGKLLGGEETDLCKRARAKNCKIYYTPDTAVTHVVEPERMKLRWLWKRAYFGGYSRAKRGGNADSFNKQSKKLVDLMALSLIAPAYMLGKAKARI